MPPAADSPAPDLAVPLYLDEPAMLDLLASIDDGFSTVERIKTTGAETGEREGSISGDASSSGFLSGVLKIGFSGSGKVSRSQSKDNVREGDRFHTPGSLLHRLRSLLLQQALLTRPGDQPSDWANVRPSDFVEFRGSFTPNPFSNAIRTMRNSLDFLANLTTQGNSTIGAAPTRGGKPSTRKDTRQQGNAFDRTLELMLNDIEHAEVQLLVIAPTEGSEDLCYQAVTTISTKYLKVPSLNELLNGEYRILGHVTRHLAAGSDASINILRGSVLGAIAESQVDQIVDSLNSQLESGDWRVQTALTTVKPPVIQIFPIAIYT